jgi:anthranilate synthase component 2
MIRVLLLDNRDSFTYNLAELLRRNDKVTFEIHTAQSLRFERVAHFDKILLSPGPGIPSEHAMIFSILSAYSQTKSILGICLGMQAIALHFGGSLFNLDEVVHGQTRRITIHDKKEPLFQGISATFTAGLYHSWAVNPTTLPGDLRVTAQSEDGVIMGLSHSIFDVRGVQFHPESIMTPEGQKILDNWVLD